MIILKYDDLIKNLPDLDYYFCIFERSYVVPHSTLGLNKKPTKRRHERESTLEILLRYQISLIPFKMASITCK